MVGDVHMKVSIHIASHTDTRLAVTRVRDRDKVRVRVRLALAIARPAMRINLEWLYTRLRVTDLTMCIASAVSRCGYRMKISILGDRSILNTQIYNCEHSGTLTRSLSLLNLGN